jgi:hypothetical protein
MSLLSRAEIDVLLSTADRIVKEAKSIAAALAARMAVSRSSDQCVAQPIGSRPIDPPMKDVKF